MATMPFTPCTTDPCSDVTVNILQTVFGPVIRNLTLGTDPSGIDPVVNVIATMMSYFNSGVLTVATLIVSFVTVMGVINTANDGEAFGKNWSSLWTPVRIVSGAAVLLPTGTGYSFIQLFVMMISLWAVGFANGTFKAGVENGIIAGTLQNVSQQIESGSNGEKKANKDFPLYNLREFASSYMAASYCARTVNAVYAAGAVTGVAAPTVMRRPQSPDRSATEAGVKTVETYELKDRNTLAPLAGGNAICGTVNLYKYSPVLPATASASDSIFSSFSSSAQNANANAIARVRDAALAAKLAAVRSMMDQIDQWIISWPADINQDWSQISANRFNEIVDGAQSAMLVNLRGIMNSDPALKALMDRFTNDITKDGWSMAGGYYQRLGGIRDEFRKIYAEPPGHVTEPALRWLPDDAKGELVRQSATMPATVVRKAIDGSGYTPTSVTDTANIRGIIPSDINDVDIDQMGSRGNKVMNSIMGNMMQSITNLAVGTDGNTDAIARIKTTGDVLATVNATLYTTTKIIDVGLTTARAATSFAGKSVIGKWTIGEGAAAAVDIVADFLMRNLVQPLFDIMTWLDRGSFYFGVFLPSLPYAIFIVAVVGWILGVLQTVFAAPLWAVMHMTPDRTFVGSQTQGYLMLLSLFMRPVLIIAALFAAMLLANPIVIYVSKAFWAMRTANVSSSESIGFLVQFYTWKNWMIMYGLVLLPVVYMIFGLCNALPDAILTWIGAGIKPLGETQATAEMRSGMERHGASLAAGAAAGGGGKLLPGGQKKIGNDKNGPDAGSGSNADNKPISDTGQASVSTPADYVAPDHGGESHSGGSRPVNSSSESAHAASRSTLSSSETAGGGEAGAASSAPGAGGSGGGGSGGGSAVAGAASAAGHAAHGTQGTASAAPSTPSAAAHAGTAAGAGAGAGAIVNAGQAASGASLSSDPQSAGAASAGTGTDPHSANPSPASRAAQSPAPQGPASAGGAGTVSSADVSPSGGGGGAAAGQDQGQPLAQKEHPVKASAKMFDQEDGEAKSAAG